MKAPVRALILLLSILAVSATQESHLTVKYDKFEDRTVVFLWEMPLAQGVVGWIPGGPSYDSPQIINLTIGTNYKTQKPTETPRDEDSAFVRLSSDRAVGLASPPDLTLIIDGQRLKIKTIWTKDYKDQVNGESVNLPVTYSVVRRLMSAKQVEGKLGITEFHLTSRNQDEIKAFMKAVSP